MYGQAVLGGGSEAFLSQVGGVASLLNAAGRIAWGELGDLLGPIETIIFLVKVHPSKHSSSLFYNFV